MLAQRQLQTRAVVAIAVAMIVIGAFLAGRSSRRQTAASTAVVPGPVSIVDGTTLGYTHTPAGATAAAAHYLLEIERAIDTLNPSRAATVAGLVATSAAAAAVAAHTAEAVQIEARDGAPLRRVAISTDLGAYGPITADVTVLEEWIYATGAREALWAIERVALAWRDGGWRIDAITGGAPSANESLADLRAQLSYPGVGDASVR